MGYQVLSLSKNEFKVVLLDWAKEEGWLYSEEDFEAYWLINSKGFWGLKYNDDFVGFVSVCKYQVAKDNNANEKSSITSVSSVGLYIMNKKFRGHGMSEKLWEKIAQEINLADIFCLNSVPKVIPYYKKRGFWNTPLANTQFNLPINTSSPSAIFVKKQFPYQTLKLAALNDIQAYETSLFPNQFIERVNFLQHWLGRPDAVCVGYYSGTKLEGYGICTHSGDANGNQRKNYRISPLYADTLEVGLNILNTLISQLNISQVNQITVNVISINVIFIQELEKIMFKLVEGSQTPLMIGGRLSLKVKQSDLVKVMGIGPLEFPNEAILLSEIDSSKSHENETVISLNLI